MNTCEDVRPLLLEADPPALAGDGDSDVARHVRACDGCAAAAQAILAATVALDRHLEGVTGVPNIEAIFAEALPSAADAGGVPTRSGVLPFRTWRRWGGLAAAAAIAGVFFLRPDATQQPPLPQTMLTPPLVESSPNQNVAVLQTANPDITVLWFF